ncbi:MAG: acyltransferase family protein [Caulobacteraceae bacterium]
MTDQAGSAGGAPPRRILALDGLRGCAAVMVVLSHYFGEVRHGASAMMFGWVGVDIFFVLSGFLIGKLILEREHHENFFQVFYIRRFFRIIPPYVLTILVVGLLIAVLPATWTDAPVRFPLWSYLTFLQAWFMITTGSIGAHWLAPMWTLAVEEHFYLLAPAAIVFAPRRWLTPALIASAGAAIAFRAMVYLGGVGNEMMALALLPSRADVIVWGMLAAIAYRNKAIDWPRYTLLLRLTPIVALLAAVALRAVSKPVFGVFGPTVVGLGCAAFILCLVLDTPEAARFRSRWLRFFGDNAYCLYLTHLTVLGLMHGLLLGAVPDVATPAQVLVTLAALPVCVLVGWGMTRLIEAPLTRYGGSWRWSIGLRRPTARVVKLAA